MHTLKKQRGITVVGMLLLAIIIGFLGLVALRLTPVYLGYYNVVQSMKALQDKSAVNIGDAANPSNMLKEKLINQLGINGVNAVEPKNITIKEQKTGYEVRVVYDVQVKIIGNVDALVHFDKSVMVTKSGS